MELYSETEKPAQPVMRRTKLNDFLKGECFRKQKVKASYGVFSSHFTLSVKWGVSWCYGTLFYETTLMTLYPLKDRGERDAG